MTATNSNVKVNSMKVHHHLRTTARMRALCVPMTGENGSGTPSPARTPIGAKTARNATMTEVAAAASASEWARAASENPEMPGQRGDFVKRAHTLSLVRGVRHAMRDEQQPLHPVPSPLSLNLVGWAMKTVPVGCARM